MYIIKSNISTDKMPCTIYSTDPTDKADHRDRSITGRLIHKC